jgi:hypothetical protein
MRARSFSARAAKRCKHERVNVRAKLRHQEGHLVGHEAMYVAAETVELRDPHVTPELPCRRQRGLELRPAVKRIGAFAGFHLHELPRDREPLGLSEVGECLSLFLNAKPERPC